MKQMIHGFTLIELLIAISLVSILAMIALPTYQHYTRRAYYSEIVQAAAPYQLGVAECFQTLGEVSECRSGDNGVPEVMISSGGMIESIQVESGVISLVPKAQHGLDEQDDYILTPLTQGGRLRWLVSGGAVRRGYVRGGD